MELITDNFFEWVVVVALAILNFIVTLKSKEKITLLLTTIISLLIASIIWGSVGISAITPAK